MVMTVYFDVSVHPVYGTRGIMFLHFLSLCVCVCMDRGVSIWLAGNLLLRFKTGISYTEFVPV